MLGDGKDVAPEQDRSVASPSRQCSPSEVLLVQQSHQLLVIFTHGHFHTRSERLHFVFVVLIFFFILLEALVSTSFQGRMCLFSH